MNKPEPSDEYEHGQMMGMLVLIQMIENARDTRTPFPPNTFENIKRVAVEGLSEYLGKPEEDIMLLVDQQLRST